MKYFVGLVGALLLMVSSETIAATSEGYGMGGWMDRFQPVIDRANATGELFRIKGHCQSSCTSFLGIRNVCVERSATLLFHASHDKKGDISPYWVDYMLKLYNAPLRQYLIKGHYLETLAFHSISGSAMIDTFGYKECPRQ